MSSISNPAASTTAERERVLKLLLGYRATAIITAAVKLGVLEEMRGGAKGEGELAQALQLNEGALRRLLRGLVLLGLAERAGDAHQLTPGGRLLLKEEAGLYDRALVTAEEYVPAWNHLDRSVRTGKVAFKEVFGMSAWEHREKNPALNEGFNRIMADDHAHSDRAIVAAYDFSVCGLVVDVGGGQGHLTLDILRQVPGATGIIFDQPHVAEKVAAKLHAAGLAGRCRAAAGSFFESVPAGGDLYLLEFILHDWDDSECVAILKTCRAAMKPGSRLLVIENLIPEDSLPRGGVVTLDLHMMVMLGGRERTQSEYGALLKEAGFALQRGIPATAEISILEAVPAP